MQATSVLSFSQCVAAAPQLRRPFTSAAAPARRSVAVSAGLNAQVRRCFAQGYRRCPRESGRVNIFRTTVPLSPNREQVSAWVLRSHAAHASRPAPPFPLPASCRRRTLSPRSSRPPPSTLRSAAAASWPRMSPTPPLVRHLPCRSSVPRDSPPFHHIAHCATQRRQRCAELPTVALHGMRTVPAAQACSVKMRLPGVVGCTLPCAGCCQRWCQPGRGGQHASAAHACTH